MKPLIPFLFLLIMPAAASAADVDDPFLWLEDVTGEKALAWVKEQNAASTRLLTADPGFAPLETRILTILDSKEQIPYVGRTGEFFTNFWRDADHPRGLWRRTTLEEYRKAEPAWEVLLDLDSLAAAEGENWQWQGAEFLKPDYRRALILLSRGGADASVVREFDVERRSFVPDGFSLPEAKSSIAWVDEDEIFVGTDFGPGSMTSSGYPRQVKLWKRGTPLASASLVFEGKTDDVGVSAYKDFSPGYPKELVLRNITTWTQELYLRRGEAWVRLDLPLDANASTHFDRLFVTLRSPWTVGGKNYPAGALLVTSLSGFLGGSRDFTELFEPSERTALQDYSSMKDGVLVNTLDHVSSRIFLWEEQGGRWTRRALPGVPGLGTVYASAVDGDRSDAWWQVATDFITPTSLSLCADAKSAPEPLKHLPAFFNAGGIEVEQFEAISADGTRVPYFQVAPRGMKLDGDHPTLLYGYGGFEISLTPSYSATFGAAWLERGNVFVIANIRGGGEFGPAWHQAALKENRHRAYEDFIAVAEDLTARKVTSPRRLGIMGGSNGGLLMGNMLTRRPDLFGAVVCQSPLLDMRRYTKLLAGASWMEEYGDPDNPAEWDFIRGFSPYHNLKQGVRYPPVLFTTSTRDDRVHPGHARKMAARMLGMGDEVLYYENIEGGHAGAADHKQSAFMNSLEFIFLRQKLEE